MLMEILLTIVFLAVLLFVAYFVLQKFYSQKITEIKYQESKRVKQKLLVMLDGDQKTVSKLLNNVQKNNPDQK